VPGCVAKQSKAKQNEQMQMQAKQISF